MFVNSSKFQKPENIGSVPAYILTVQYTVRVQYIHDTAVLDLHKKVFLKKGPIMWTCLEFFHLDPHNFQKS